MNVTATVLSDGRVTVPMPVREALGLNSGDQVLFRVAGARVTVARTPDLLELAGTIVVPAGKRDTPWDAVRRDARAARAMGSRREA